VQLHAECLCQASQNDIMKLWVWCSDAGMQVWNTVANPDPDNNPNLTSSTYPPPRILPVARSPPNTPVFYQMSHNEKVGSPFHFNRQCLG